MKRLLSTSLVLSLFSFSAVASDFLKCDFKIPDNKVKCPLIGKCPQKVLKTSETSLHIELFDGVPAEGEITLNKVIIDPGTKKESKNDIVLFSDDVRFQELEDKVDLINYEVGERINYSVTRYGNAINIVMNSGVARGHWTLRGNVTLQTYFLTSESAINVQCQTITRAIYEEQNRKQKALEEFKQRKEEKQKSSAQEA
ncbi:MAG: hypothetical protein WCY48_08480 [Candidatus Caldatribacteriota bacterium]